MHVVTTVDHQKSNSSRNGPKDREECESALMQLIKAWVPERSLALGATSESRSASVLRLLITVQTSGPHESPL